MFKLVVSIVLLVMAVGCASNGGAREKAANISCDTCAVVDEYHGLVSLAAGVITDRIGEIKVQLGTEDTIDALTIACELRNKIVDRRIDAGQVKVVSECDEKRRAQ